MVTLMLLERAGELATLDGLVDGLGQTGGKVVLIRGEAGIGKSALIDAFLRGRRERAEVDYGTCDDLFIPQPLGPFWDMARERSELRGPLAQGDRASLLDAVLARLSRTGRPTIVVIEDTHWADEATLDAIRYLGRRVARTNGLMLLTYRDGEVDYDHPLRGVIGDIPVGSIARIQLQGLSAEAVSELVAEAQLDPDEVFRATRGNPLLVTEMACAPADAVPASLHESSLARVGRLSIGSQELLKLLSVIPEPIPRTDVLRLPGAEDERIDECVKRGFLDVDSGPVAFRHDLIRRAVESSMSDVERQVKLRAVLDGLPEDTHPCLLIHCAVEVEDVDRVVDLAPRSARYAAATGSHIQAAEDFRELGPYLDHVPAADLGPLLDEWARAEFLVDAVPEAIRINELARRHYRGTGDHAAESRALADASQYCENAGQRSHAEALAREAVDVLGAEPDGADLARALEVNAYLQMMSGNVASVPRLVERTLAAGGPDIDESVLIRSLNHRGIVENIANYPHGRTSLDEARRRAEAAGQWYEECRALLNHAWAGAEARDLPVASDYAQRAIASAVRHGLPGLELYATGMYARTLELRGDWDEAADLARGSMDAAAITRMVALPILGVIEARRGRPSATGVVMRGWELAAATGEVQRTVPAAIAVAESAWITGDQRVPASDLRAALDAGLDLGFSWSTGAIASWLWELGALETPPDGIAQPFRDLIEARPRTAAAAWERLGIPYEHARALAHGDEADQLRSLELLETLGATAVAAKLRRSMRERGIAVPRGKGRNTRRHAAGLTPRQAEVLALLAENLTNMEIADRLFVSPRTVENHVAAVLDKLDVVSRADAAERARADALL